MVYVCLTEAATLVVVVLTFAGLLRSKERACARREDLILNKLLHSVGRTWSPPPSVEPAVTDGNETVSWPNWTAAPEQEPVY